MTPAYDICPQGRSGNEATQAMLISGDNRMSILASCFDAAHQFLLPREEARFIALNQVKVIGENWNIVCAEAKLSGTDRKLLWGRQFLNEFAFLNLHDDELHLKEYYKLAGYLKE